MLRIKLTDVLSGIVFGVVVLVLVETRLAGIVLGLVIAFCLMLIVACSLGIMRIDRKIQKQATEAKKREADV